MFNSETININRNQVVVFFPMDLLCLVKISVLVQKILTNHLLFSKRLHVVNLKSKIIKISKAVPFDLNK